MKRAKPLPSRLTLNDLFVYDNGRLLWRNDGTGGVKSGNEAGYVNNGYRKVKVGSKLYFGHRLIWKLLYGEDPIEIDHINGDSLDNRITNLRSVTNDDNRRNMTRDKRNTSGVTGVSRQKGKWRAQLSREFLGLFDTFEKAVAARKEAELTADYHTNHGRATTTDRGER